MNLKICSNIVRLRKLNNITQATLAEYLGVSPQAVSKWESEAAVPDVFLLPHIALFFGISMDDLFGITDLDSAKLLLSRYKLLKTDRDFNEAKEAIYNILNLEPNNIKALTLKYELEYHRGIEYLEGCVETCKELQELCKDKDEAVFRHGTVFRITVESMLQKENNVAIYNDRYTTTQSAEDFNYLLIALGNVFQYKQMIEFGKRHINSFSREDQLIIYPNLMEAAYQLADLDYALECFNYIIEDKDNISQVFNGWWLLYFTYQKTGHEKEANECREKLLDLLPIQPTNEYNRELIRRKLEER